MCGIVGYVGYRTAVDVLLDGMKRLEYRGYDSAGVAVSDEDGLKIVKEVGKVADLEKALRNENMTGTRGIGHTRWATHGGVSVVNAHPHCDQCRKVVLVHNGIIENFQKIKGELSDEGVTFLSQTDTEVAAQLLSRMFEGDPIEALVRLNRRLNGSFALAIIMNDVPDKIYCIRRGSPLVLGSGKGEAFCASDVPALLPYTQDVCYLDDGDIAELGTEEIRVFDGNGIRKTPRRTHIDWDITMVDKCGYPHFMLKEMNEQSLVLRNGLEGRVQEGVFDLSREIGLSRTDIMSLDRVHFVACGSSYYAALAAERLLEKVTDFDIRVDVSSEYRYRNLPMDDKTLAVFVSQSGETADTLAAVRKARSEGARTLAITNVPGSTITREVRDVLLLKAGPEIGVAATKTFMAQMTTLSILSLYLARHRGTFSVQEQEEYADAFKILPYKVESVLQTYPRIQALAKKYSSARDFLFLGRGASFPIALEGALKLKEISYIHAEAYAAGEMKHGPIALLDPSIPVFVVAPRDSLYEKTVSNILEAKARRSPVIALTTEGNEEIAPIVDDVLEIPQTMELLSGFLSVIPLQLFAYAVARERGCDIDQPRNLAKSVTVE